MNQKRSRHTAPRLLYWGVFLFYVEVFLGLTMFMIAAADWQSSRPIFAFLCLLISSVGFFSSLLFYIRGRILNAERNGEEVVSKIRNRSRCLKTASRLLLNYGRRLVPQHFGVGDPK